MRLINVTYDNRSFMVKVWSGGVVLYEKVKDDFGVEYSTKPYVTTQQREVILAEALIEETGVNKVGTVELADSVK